MSKEKLIPELRFPEFVSDGDWEEKTLGEVAERIEEKVNGKQLTTASISAGIGFVSQAKKFSRDISGAQYKNYIVLNEGEFSYNKGNSKRFPQGCIYKLKEFEQVAVPNAFISFRFKPNFICNFFQGYFDNNYHGKQLQQFITSGARMDGLLNIKAKDFFSIVLPTPSKAEQQKIAGCLSSLNELITANKEKLEALKAHKKGLMQNLFPQEGQTVPNYRFPDFEDDGEWVEMEIGQICKMQAGKFVNASNIKQILTDKLFPCYGGNGLRGFTESFTHNGIYSLIGRQGALCGNVNIVDGIFHATEHAVVVYPTENIDTYWLYYLLLFSNLNQYATGQAQPGLSVTNLESVKKIVPKSIQEQQKIAACLKSVDEMIKAQKEKIEYLQLHKKGLMQGLFPKTTD